MKKVNIDYSVKNIPIPSKRLYLKTLLDKLENFIKRLRWKAFYFDKKQEKLDSDFDSFGFKTEKKHPHNTKGLQHSKKIFMNWLAISNPDQSEINSKPNSQKT